jgi:hypothetical protein
METLPERAVRALLIAIGVATATFVPPLAQDSAPSVPALYHQYVLLLLALTLAAAAFVPAMRFPAVGAAVVVKAGFVAIALAAPGAPGSSLYAELALLAGLLATAALLLREWQREARWDGRIRGRMGA